jgi:hypothetical protein
VDHVSAADRPITTFELHLHTGEADGQEGRFREINSVIARVKELLDTSCTDCSSNALSFNKDNNPSIKAPGNRVILTGDFNIYSHACGEHYYLLRRLREEFGFAVDAAMAAEGSVEFAYAMHNYDSETVNGGEPKGFMLSSDWSNMTLANPNKWLLPPNNSEFSYPWWAHSYRGKTSSPGYGSDRHDMVLLVGQGWASDDAVRSYAVMQDNNKPNPFAVRDDNGNVLGGVEMYHAESTTGEAGIPNSGNNYNPSYDVGGGTGPGRPAFVTDHRPIMTRLRLLSTGVGDR